ncbi:MFS transporter [Jatrophihabitans sp. YIM 134969]
MTTTTPRRWTALLVLCLAELLVSIDNTIVNVALPTMSRELTAGTSGLQWIVDAYTLVFAGLLLAAGHLGDRTGRRRTLVIGLAGFGATSVAAALVTDLGGLIATRAVMGAFAALIFPATLAIITNIFTTAKERVAAVGIWSGIAGVAVALGPVTGGFLLEHFSWHSVFWVNVPLAAAAIVLTLWCVPDSRDPAAARLDVVGVLASVAAVVAVVWSVIEGPNRGWTSPVVLGGFALGAALLAGFVGWERRHPHPVLDVTLFLNRRFSAAAGAIAVAFFGLFGFIFMITQFFQAVQGYGTLDAGLRTLPFAIVIGVCAPISVQLAARIGTTVVVSAGLLLMAAGFTVAAATASVGLAYWGPVIVAMCLMAAGLGLVSGPATEAVMGALPLARAGAGSAVNDTTREIGGTLGVAVIGSVMAALYGSRIAEAVGRFDLSGTDLAAARSSVVGGLEVAQRTGNPELADVVKTSFVDGLQHGAAVAAGACFVAAVLVALALPARGGARHGDAARPTTAADETPALPLGV